MMETKRLKSETVIQENLLHSDPTVPLTSFTKSMTEFDENGNQILEMSWDSHGNVEQILKSYYEDGVLTRQEVFLDEGELTEEHEFLYNEEGTLRTEKCIYAESGHETIDHEYDGSNHLIRKVYKDEEGLIESYEEWEYDGDELIAERRVEEDETVYEHHWDYEDGKLVSESIHEEFVEMQVVYEVGNPEVRKQIRNGVLISTQTTTFDEQGRAIKTEDSSAQGVRVMTMEYDALGNETLRQEWGPSGDLIVKVIRVYDESGRFLEMEVEANTRGIGIDRHYKYRYEYQYWD